MMTDMRCVRFSLVGCIGVLVSLANAGCDDRSPKVEAEVMPAPVAEPEVAEPTLVRGLAAPANDPEVVALTNEVLKCEYSEQKGFVGSCDARAGWGSNELLKRENTLVEMLFDSRASVRILAAEGLQRQGRAYRTMKSLADQVLTAIDAERNDNVIPNLATAAGQIDLSATGNVEVMSKMLLAHPKISTRRSLVAQALSHVNAELFDVYVQLIRTDKDTDIREAAVRRLWANTPAERFAEQCSVWMEASLDKEPSVASVATSQAAWNNNCYEHWDTLLDQLSELVQGKIATREMAYAFPRLHAQKSASQEQKDRALALAYVGLEHESNNISARANLFKFIASVSPARAEKLAKKYVDHENYSLKSAAKRILNPKDK